MKKIQYDQIAVLEQDNWWYTAKRKLFAKLIEHYCTPITTALDVGCGTGANMRVLKQWSKNVWGIDISIQALNYCRKNKLHNVKQGSIENIPFPANMFDLVLCSDVIEHVDDNTAIKEIHRVLKPKGHVIISVPAFRSLWNDNDDISQHLRRYRKKEVRTLLKQFSIEKLTYWNTSLFLPAWIMARKQKFFPSKQKKNNLSLIPSFFNTLLKHWFALENALTVHGRMPFGVSIIAVARKLK